MRQHWQGFMECWKTPHQTASTRTKSSCWMKRWNKIGCSQRWEIQKFCKKNSLPEKKKKKKQQNVKIIHSPACHRKKKRLEWMTGNHFHSALEDFHSSLCTYYRYARHVVIEKGFCFSRSPNLSQNLLLRKRPTYTKSKLERRLIGFPDLIIYCAYRFMANGFIFPSLAIILGFVLCLYPILNWNAGVPLPPKLLAKLKSRVQAPVPTAFHHLLIGPSAAETGLSRLSSLPLRLASLSTLRVWHVQFSISPPFFFFALKAEELVPGIRWQVLGEVMMTQSWATEWIKLYWEI